MYLYKGHLESVSAPHSIRLKTALQRLIGAEVTPLLLRVELKWFKEEGDVLWSDVTEVDEVSEDERRVYNNMLGEYILPCLNVDDIQNVVAIEGHCKYLHLNLTRPLELVFKLEGPEMSTKTRKDGTLLRDKAPECGGRVLYRLQDSVLSSITYLK